MTRRPGASQQTALAAGAHAGRTSGRKDDREAGPVAAPGDGHDPATHRTHKDVVNRLRRATGHLQMITGMIEGGRECTDIAQQMHAVIRALQAARTILVHDHIEHCLEEAIGPTSREQRAAIEEFKKISRYL